MNEIERREFERLNEKVALLEKRLNELQASHNHLLRETRRLAEVVLGLTS